MKVSQQMLTLTKQLIDSLAFAASSSSTQRKSEVGIEIEIEIAVEEEVVGRR